MNEDSLNWYILKDNHSIKRVSLQEWSKWAGKSFNQRRVNQTFVDKVNISTMFLIAPMWDDRFFETMVFDGPLDSETEHYATWDEAEAGHQEMVARVKSAMEEAKE